jgi:hypothetical protein
MEYLIFDYHHPYLFIFQIDSKIIWFANNFGKYLPFILESFLPLKDNFSNYHNWLIYFSFKNSLEIVNQWPHLLLIEKCLIIYSIRGYFKGLRHFIILDLALSWLDHVLIFVSMVHRIYSDLYPFWIVFVVLHLNSNIRFHFTIFESDYLFLPNL